MVEAIEIINNRISKLINDRDTELQMDCDNTSILIRNYEFAIKELRLVIKELREW